MALQVCKGCGAKYVPAAACPLCGALEWLSEEEAAVAEAPAAEAPAVKKPPAPAPAVRPAGQQQEGDA